MTLWRIEIIPLILNIGITVWYAYDMSEPGKILYWLGASVMTVGLLLMRG